MPRHFARVAMISYWISVSFATAAFATVSGVPADDEAAAKPGDDEAAVRAVGAEFTRLFNADDAHGLAGLFTEKARIVAVDGTVIDGREAIERQFAAIFAQSPGNTIEIKVESLRFLGSEAAIEEGISTFAARPVEGEPAPPPVSSRYVVGYVKQAGKWLQDSIRDFPLTLPGDPTDKTAHEQLQRLDWLVGEWIDEGDDAEVHTSCQWSDNGSFLLRSFEIHIHGRADRTGSQRIGWDPRVKQLRSWVFDSDGGFSEGVWSKQGDRWLIKSTGVLKDGRSVSATNIIDRTGRDSYRWSSIERTLDGEVLPDAEEITLVRRPPRPRPARIGPDTKGRNPGSTAP